MIEGIFIDVGVIDDDHYEFISTTTTLLSYDTAGQFDNKMAKYYHCLSSIEFYKEHPLLLLRRSFYLDFQKAYVSTSTTLQVQ